MAEPKRFRPETRMPQFFDLFNHPNFGSPGTTFGTSSFAVISSANDGRTIQFGLKLLF